MTPGRRKDWAHVAVFVKISSHEPIGRIASGFVIQIFPHSLSVREKNIDFPHVLCPGALWTIERSLFELTDGCVHT